MCVGDEVVSTAVPFQYLSKPKCMLDIRMLHGGHINPYLDPNNVLQNFLSASHFSSCFHFLNPLCRWDKRILFALKLWQLQVIFAVSVHMGLFCCFFLSFFFFSPRKVSILCSWKNRRLAAPEHKVRVNLRQNAAEQQQYKLPSALVPNSSDKPSGAIKWKLSVLFKVSLFIKNSKYSWTSDSK